MLIKLKSKVYVFVQEQKTCMCNLHGCDNIWSHGLDTVHVEISSQAKSIELIEFKEMNSQNARTKII